MSRTAQEIIEALEKNQQQIDRAVDGDQSGGHELIKLRRLRQQLQNELDEADAYMSRPKLRRVS